MKALNNYIAAAGYTAVAEALLIGQRFGLNQEAMVDILNASTGRNFTTEVMVKEHVLSGKFATGFALGLMAKDVRIAADLGEAVGSTRRYRVSSANAGRPRATSWAPRAIRPKPS